MSDELQYLLVVVGLFIVPRALQRFRVPAAITGVALGAVLGMGLGLFQADTVIPVLATLGIVGLFLFAGMEVDFAELRSGWAVTVGHLAVLLLLLAGGAWVSSVLFELAWRPALLLALAVFTPSTGFILDSLPAFGLSPTEQYWVKTKAIASELVALLGLFVVVQSGSVLEFSASAVALAGMVLVLPWIFQAFAARVLPFAPKSEFAFLVILALVCASVTRQLGVYYLVGAFVVGVTAVRLRKRLPALASERLLIGIELFASFFAPFYFFKAGLHLEAGFFGWDAVLLGLAFVAVSVPTRVGVVAAFRRMALGEPLRSGTRVGLSLVPTLVFTLVLAGILRERFGLSDRLFGALVVYALINTTLPGVALRWLSDGAPAAAAAPATTPDAPGEAVPVVSTELGPEVR